MDITSTNAAKIFGLYPQKGAIAAGSDADITIIDPSIKGPLASTTSTSKTTSIWEGWPIEGWPVTTILRGTVMVEDRNLRGTPSTGRFLRRKIDSRSSQSCLLTPAIGHSYGRCPKRQQRSL